MSSRRRLVQPGEGALDDPAVAAEPGAVLGLAAGDHRFDAALPDQAAVLVVVVAAVGEHASGRRRGPAERGRGPVGRRSSSGISWVTSLRLPPVSVQASGMPPPSVRAGGAWSRGGPGRPGSGPSARPLFRLEVARVGDRPRPVELAGGVQLGQQQLVQPLPDAGLLPVPQPPPAGHPAAEAELLRQVLPGDPGVQHEQDPAATPTGHRAACGPDTGTDAASAAAAARSAPTAHPTQPTATPASASPPSLTTDADDFALSEAVPSLS